MADYLFSYAYVVDGHWHFDYLVFELPRFTHEDMEEAQKKAARRHDKPEKIYYVMIVPIAVSKLDSPNVRMKITDTTKTEDERDAERAREVREAIRTGKMGTKSLEQARAELKEKGLLDD